VKFVGKKEMVPGLLENAATVGIRKQRGFPSPLGKISPKGGSTFPHFHRPYWDLSIRRLFEMGATGGETPTERLQSGAAWPKTMSGNPALGVKYRVYGELINGTVIPCVCCSCYNAVTRHLVMLFFHVIQPAFWPGRPPCRGRRVRSRQAATPDPESIPAASPESPGIGSLHRRIVRPVNAAYPFEPFGIIHAGSRQ
jgi:hypothetical protein